MLLHRFYAALDLEAGPLSLLVADCSLDKVVSRKTTISGLLALCGLALLAQHVSELGSNFHGDHLFAGVLMLTLAVIVWFLPSEPYKE